MKLKEYAGYDGLGLAKLVARKEVSPKELAKTALAAIEKINPEVNCVVETYADRIGSLRAASLGDGPFRGVPFLIKDVFGHEAGRKIEFGSRLCEGMVGQVDSNLIQLLRKAGINNLGRTAAPEFSMSGTTESKLYGNTSTPWKKGYSAGGSSGGAQAAVVAGIVPLAHGSDIGGSIRIPASFCGGLGFKPSRMRVSVGPTVDEGGWGYSSNFVQAKTMRDVATMLDCLSIPMAGDPFIIPRPETSYAKLFKTAPKRLRIGIVMEEFCGVKVDKEVVAAVKTVAMQLQAMGHIVEPAKVSLAGVNLMELTRDLFFFDFDNRINGLAAKTGRKPGPDTLESVIWSIYQRAKEITPARFTSAWAKANIARRSLGAFFSTYDLWLSPTTARTAESFGTYHLSLKGADFDSLGGDVFAPVVQHTIPHNLMGTPAISMPLVMHSNGLPIGIQLAGRPSEDHVVLQAAYQLEKAMPWAKRVPPLHVSR